MLGEDLNGCVSSAVADVTVNAVPVVTVNSGAICAGDNFIISPAGADAYTISGGSATVSRSGFARAYASYACGGVRWK